MNKLTSFLPPQWSWQKETCVKRLGSVPFGTGSTGVTGNGLTGLTAGRMIVTQFFLLAHRD